MNRVALYLGDSLPPNLVRFLSGVAELADDSFEFVVVGCTIDPSSLPDRFEYFEALGESTNRGISRIIAAYRRVSQYLRNTDAPPDAIWQITSPQFHALPVLLAARRRGVPMAARIPGNKFDEYREQTGSIDTAKTALLNNIALRTLRYATLVVTLSEYNRAELRSRGVRDETIRVLRPPLNTREFAPAEDARSSELRRDLGFDESSHAILYVGRLSELKGMGDLEEVVDHFEGEDYDFHFVGTGDFVERLEAYDNTVLHGFVSPTTIHRYYKAADLLVHPSYVEEEGISWTMLEAAATKLPVVARDVGNAAAVASYVFSDTDDFIAYLSEPSGWSVAAYPSKWSIEALAPEYNEFFSGLVSDHE